jgi:hypothetical protein
MSFIELTSVASGRAHGWWTSNSARLSPLFTRQGSASHSYR